jgi:hypothetical protein
MSDTENELTPEEKLHDLQREIKQLRATNHMTAWDNLKSFFSGFKDLLMGRISMVPELTYREMNHMAGGVMKPPDIDAITDDKKKLEVIQTYAAIKASEVQIFMTVASLHYKTGAGWLVGRIFKGLMGMWIMLRIVETLSPIWS